MSQKKWPLIAASVFCLMLIPAVALAKGGEDHFGPYSSTSADGGSCGQPWAQDTFNRFFTVKEQGNNTFYVKEEFKDGTFVTTGPASPGACETTSDRHGSTVLAGINGNMHGTLEGTVSSSTYNPNGCSVSGADCTTTQGFLAAVFGPAGPATFTCNLGYAGCKFNFEYNSDDHRLVYHHWQDKSDNHNGEKFEGDIATQ